MLAFLKIINFRTNHIVRIRTVSPSDIVMFSHDLGLSIYELYELRNC